MNTDLQNNPLVQWIKRVQSANRAGQLRREKQARLLLDSLVRLPGKEN